MGKLPSELENIPAIDLAEWSAFRRVFGPLTIQERVDWIGAEIVSVLVGEKDVAKGLLEWDPRPPQPSVEIAKAMKLESLLKGAMQPGNGI